MRTVVVVSAADEKRGGGVATHIATLGKVLQGYGWRPIVSLNSTSGFRRILWLLTVWGLSLPLRLHSKGLWFVGRAFISDILIGLRGLVLGIVYRANAVSVHGRGVWPLAIAKRLLGLPFQVVLTVHGYPTAEAIMNGFIDSNDRLARKLSLRLERLNYRSADTVICVDVRLARHVRFLTNNQAKVKVLHNSTHVLHVTRDPQNGFVLCPRMLTAKNGVDVAIKAVKRVPNLQLVIAGDGPERAALERLAAGCDRIRFLGALPHSELIELYKRAEVVVIPSITVKGVREATSISALEAMAAGVPVVASRIGGLAHIIDHGIDGLLVREGDPEELADALKLIHSNRPFAEALSRNAQHKVQLSFNIDKWAKEYDAVLSGQHIHVA